ncbi:hypothetical protein COCC4DRAFT_147322 [Bipolaris maydis ATCC 48331]|uniref:Rhodopsin domain-containing protein n=2 Tax=Cochliobolus heterostrophus TaxID=5016 RepID=M2V4K5_COCH5|nr:uncharacterized protein COCC4DRAFT_147322 [Bipolaris maydis ATCC 48331]EMD94917.1 hypothetical protein COCHEDRAFT_1090859 [Bipolaris maydis C5]KAJ5029312.1 hypothetical protein J3E73DRAFT_254389 [Bipolaris maydis]ENI01792.1 hypothetical protein COCC4DRAFT_147322 [Bipolaris maydis ATCC 48331]KAJ5061951.1 hypothetical protein J3E74DRAFT_427352 [Bipolaris maydis]KAJ6192714.1 hypothetical protein J3E72DRAFT_204103 [Bipolaris maydis]
MHRTIPIENGRQLSIVIASSISISIAVIAVGLRLAAKRIRNRVDGSDWCIVVACLWNAALHGTCISLVTHGGFGFHLAEVMQRFGPGTVTYFFKGLMTFTMLWNATVCFSKLSVLLMYSALIPTPTMIRMSVAFGAFIVVWCLADIMTAFLICRPLARNWDITVPGTCGSRPDFYFAMGVINLVTDALLIGMPMPYLYKLAMPMRKKLLAMGLLSIGIGTWAIIIYRQTLIPHLDLADMTYSGILATLLSGLEPAVAIVLACIPLLRPLFVKSRHNLDSGYRYGSSNGKHISFLSKRGGGSSALSHGLDPTATFSELVDHQTNNSSQIELRPVEGIQRVCISSDEERGKEERGKTMANGGVPPRTISVERMWEVKRSHG